MRLTLVLTLFLVAAKTASAQVYTVGNEPDLNALNSRDLSGDTPRALLEALLQGRLGVWDAPEALARVAVSGDTTVRPLLKQVITAYEQSSNFDLAYGALYALWELGEPESFFLAQAARDFSPTSGYAIRAASAYPDSAFYQQLLTLSNTRAVRDYGNEYRAMLQEWLPRYRAMPLDRQIGAALGGAMKGFRFPGQGERDPTFFAMQGLEDIRPMAVWGRRELARLYTAHPAEVQAEIALVVESVRAVYARQGTTLGPEVAAAFETFIRTQLPVSAR